MLLQVTASRAVDVSHIKQVFIFSPTHVVLNLGQTSMGRGAWIDNDIDLYNQDAEAFLRWYHAYSISWHRRPNGRPRPPRQH